MPSFQPPTVDDVGPVLPEQLPIPPFPRGGPEQRLFAHFKSRARGRTVILKNDDTCVTVDYPAQMVPAWQEVGDPFTETGLAGIPYTSIARVFTGGHIYYVTDAEAAALLACGGHVAHSCGWGECPWGEDFYGG